MNARLTIQTLTLVAGATALAACGGSSSSKTTALSGVYAVQSHTENTAGCMDEGMAVTGGNGFLAVYLTSFLGQQALQASPCNDTASCQEAVDKKPFNLFAYTMSSGDDAAGWSDTVSSASGSDTCEGVYSKLSLTSTAMGEIKLETRSADVPNVTKKADGTCSLEDVQSRGPSADCARYTVIRATKQ